MLDVAGQDATEAFEDVGHSDEARETLDQLFVAPLKRKVQSLGTRLCDNMRMNILTILSIQEGDPTPKATLPGAVQPANTGDATGLGIGLYAFVLIGGAAAFFGYQYLQAQQESSS